MAKYIKTRNKFKGVKALDKSVTLSKRMKNAFVRTKDKANETQNSNENSPADYASNNVQDTTQSMVRHFSNPRRKARESIERAKGHFQEVKRQMPKERRRTADQAKKTAHNTQTNAGQLKKSADKAKETAREAKNTVKDAKQTLREVRQSGRQTLHEVRQKAKLEQSANPSGNPTNANPGRDRLIKSIRSEIRTRSRIKGETQKSPSLTGGKTANPTSASGKPLSSPADNSSNGAGSRPNYLSGKVKVNAGDTAKSLEKSVKSAKKGFKKTAKGTIKTAKKSVKTAERTAKKAVKTAKQAAKTAHKTAQTTAKAAKIAAKTARAAAKAAVWTAKAAAKAIIALVKATIAAIKGLVAIIAAGGWVAVVVILIICMIGLLVGSVFGIFFSDEPNHSTGKTINSVIAEIDADYTGKIDGIINASAYDLLDMSGARATWKQVLAVYTVKTVTDPDNPMEVATMDDEKAAILKTVFWDMNVITNTLDTVEVDEDVLGEDGLPTGDTTKITKTVLRITVSHKKPNEMAALYRVKKFSYIKLQCQFFLQNRQKQGLFKFIWIQFLSNYRRPRVKIGEFGKN